MKVGAPETLASGPSWSRQAGRHKIVQLVNGSWPEWDLIFAFCPVCQLYQLQLALRRRFATPHFIPTDKPTGHWQPAQKESLGILSCSLLS